MVLPTFTPTRGIFPAVSLLPMKEKIDISDGNRKCDLASEISSLIQSRVAARDIKAGTSFDVKRYFVVTEFEP